MTDRQRLNSETLPDRPFAVVLGTAQDAGYPQAGCRSACCTVAWEDPARRVRPVCLGLVDQAGRRYMIDCTPEFPEQLRHLDRLAPPSKPGLDLSGVLLTHAHVGHYTGLMHLGREAADARGVPLHVMPRMSQFLSSAGPWSQLVEFENVELRPLHDQTPVELSEDLTVVPFLVPHRDELSETVGFRIEGPSRTLIWLPDIDKWDRWTTAIEEVIATSDVAYLDATFFAEGEIPGRPMAEIPHPFVAETIERLATLPAEERAKVRFVHLNHTNPALDPSGQAAQTVRGAGHHVARQGELQAL